MFDLFHCKFKRKQEKIITGQGLFQPAKYKMIPCHKKMRFLEEYVLLQWGLTQQQMLLAQRQVYTQIHAAT